MLTQVEICCITGVSRASLTQWLADPEKTITFSTASKLIGLVGLRKFMLLAERHSGREAMEGVNLDQFRKQQQWREQREAIISQTVRDFQERYQTGRVEQEDQEDVSE